MADVERSTAGSRDILIPSLSIESSSTVNDERGSWKAECSHTSSECFSPDAWFSSDHECTTRAADGLCQIPESDHRRIGNAKLLIPGRLKSKEPVDGDTPQLLRSGSVSRELGSAPLDRVVLSLDALAKRLLEELSRSSRFSDKEELEQIRCRLPKDWNLSGDVLEELIGAAVTKRPRAGEEKDDLVLGSGLFIEASEKSLMPKYPERGLWLNIEREDEVGRRSLVELISWP
jgi:hypothetical protein